MYDEPLFIPAGDQALVVEIGGDISPETNGRVCSLAAAIEGAETVGVVEVVPTYRSLLVYYDPGEVTAAGLEDTIRQLEVGLEEHRTQDSNIIQVPTLYGGEHGPDLEFVARHAGLSDGRGGLHPLRDRLPRIHDGLQPWVLRIWVGCPRRWRPLDWRLRGR